MLFFAPCGCGGGIGIAYSDDLLVWRDIHLLEFPQLPWADGGPSAAMVLDAREDLGIWLMAFHAGRTDNNNSHAAAIGLAWSSDLVSWDHADR